MKILPLPNEYPEHLKNKYVMKVSAQMLTIWFSHNAFYYGSSALFIL